MKGDIFGIPAEAVSGIPAVRLLGNELTEIINHKGLRRCTEEEICILTKIGDISVKEELADKVYEVMKGVMEIEE